MHGSMATATADAVHRAEVSNYEIVNHYFDVATERLGLREDLATVIRTPYREHFRWDERQVNERLGKIMRGAFREVAARAEQQNTSLRVAAYELGIERVVETATTRGYISV
jgi:hypothetical protein